LVVLVDSGSVSCAELFARLMQIEKQGVVMDDHSAGAVMEFDITAKELEHRDFLWRVRYRCRSDYDERKKFGVRWRDARRTDSPYRN
jgi:hypothetical protein